MRCFILVLSLLLLSTLLFGQKTKVKPADPPPAGMTLLANYVHEKGQGIDTAVGAIRKERGMMISYDIGNLAGNYAMANTDEEKANLIWTKTQKRNGLTLMLSYSRNGVLVATFRETCANFVTNDATSDERIADFILMITTYQANAPDLSKVPQKMRINYGC